MAGGTVYRAGGVTELEGDEGAGTSNSTVDVFRSRCLWGVQVGVSGRQVGKPVQKLLSVWESGNCGYHGAAGEPDRSGEEHRKREQVTEEPAKGSAREVCPAAERRVFEAEEMMRSR